MITKEMAVNLRYGQELHFGGLDSHCHHYRIVASALGRLSLLAKHGAGQERIRLSSFEALRQAFAAMDSTARYWILNTIFHAASDGEVNGRTSENLRWRKAAAEKRIHTRKLRGGEAVKVWIAA